MNNLEERSRSVEAEPPIGGSKGAERAPAYTPPPPFAQGNPVVDPRRKSPVLATVLSLMPGLGQIYVGYYRQGFINILVVASLITLLSAEAGALTPLLALFMAFYWLYNLVDAGRRAAFYNQALVGLDPLHLPEEMEMPSSQGALLGGVVLLLLGLLFLGHNLLQIPLEWLEDWWPVVLIGIGGYLVYKARVEKRQSE
ncbi:MAG: LiaI-LiaF-like domain-containing protein [Acidobacteriota bacterium]